MHDNRTPWQQFLASLEGKVGFSTYVITSWIAPKLDIVVGDYDLHPCLRQHM